MEWILFVMGIKDEKGFNLHGWAIRSAPIAEDSLLLVAVGEHTALE
jgi:hypothetical protein